MIYARGHASDFNRWDRGGVTGWSYADCLPYFKKSETYELGMSVPRFDHIQFVSKRNPLAKFRRRTLRAPNRMQMRKILCFPSLAFDSAHAKYGV